MRRFISLAIILFSTVSFGVSLSGCKKALATEYCNAGESGPTVGQVASITLSPALATYGESLSYGQIGQGLSASALDCKGNSVSVRSFVYASSDTSRTYADINPSTGSVCAGSWNRNTGGGIADYTTCNEPPCILNPSLTACAGVTYPYVAYLTATAAGAVSNAVPVYIHQLVTGIVLGTPTPSCSTSTDPGTDCCPGNTITATPYPQNVCISQGKTAQLIARVYANGDTFPVKTPSNNITCQVGHLTYSANTAGNILAIDQNGVATANQPGSTLISAFVANSSNASSAGYFSTCPPASIVLSVPGQPAGTTSVAVSLNNPQSLVATVLDTNGATITGLGLEYVSTTPQTVLGGSTITPTFPGAATITAVCQQGACNPSPFSQLDYLGNGVPLTSNGINVTTAGTSSTVLFMGSLSSQYIVAQDFTTNLPSSLVKLPYAPNSMVISQDGTTVYMGSTGGLMTFSTLSSAVSAANANVQGTVLAISPDGQNLVVTDSIRGTVSLIAASTGALETSYGGVGTRAVWSPDSQTVYIATTTPNLLLTHSAVLNWQSVNISSGATYSDIAITVPSEGAYFAGGTKGTEGRSYCPSSNITNATITPPTTTSTFSPLADSSAAITDRIAATNDGKHILGATANAPATLSDLNVTLPTQNVSGATVPAACPIAGAAQVTPGYFKSVAFSTPLTGITATKINGVIPATNSALAFITYNGTSGLLPVYVPAASGLGALTYLRLTPVTGFAAPTAPVAGVFSTDNNTFYVGTTGDNLVHKITITGTTAIDAGTLNPQLPDANGNIVTPNLLVQRPKKVTS